MAYKPSPFESASGVVVYATKNSGDSDNRYQVDSDGVASWGSGAAAVDVSLSRGAADQLDLAAGDSFHVLSGHVRVAGSGGTGVAYIDLDDGSSVTTGGVGEVRFRSNAGVFEISENGAAFAAPGGGTPTFDDIYNNSGVDPAITVDNGPLILSDGGSLPSLSANTVLVLASTLLSTDDVEMSFITGTNGLATINFGDTSDEDDGSFRWTSATQKLEYVLGTTNIVLQIDGTGLKVNPGGNAAYDLLVGGDTLTHMIFTDATATTQNIALLAGAAPDWQNGDQIVYWGSVSSGSEPTAAPAGGAFMYVDLLGNLQALNEAAEVQELATPERREWWWQVNGNDTTAEAVAMAAPTATGAALANDGATGPFIQYDTSTTINLDAGWNGATNGTRTDWGPVMTACIATDVAITDVRIWVGMFSADPMGAADPTLHLAAFRYDTAADGTAFWRCVTEDGTTINVTTTTIAIAIDTVYNLRIDARNSASIKFYINGVLAATHTTNLPTSTTDLDAYAELRNLAAASKFFNLNKVHMATK